MRDSEPRRYDKAVDGRALRSNLHRVVSAPGKQEDVARYSVAYLVRAEGKTSMRRLAVERSLIEKAGEGE
jgi:isopenicillin N synthase-like dioxygenase